MCNYRYVCVFVRAANDCYIHSGGVHTCASAITRLAISDKCYNYLTILLRQQT